MANSRDSRELEKRFPEFEFSTHYEIDIESRAELFTVDVKRRDGDERHQFGYDMRYCRGKISVVDDVTRQLRVADMAKRFAQDIAS